AVNTWSWDPDRTERPPGNLLDLMAAQGIPGSCCLCSARALPEALQVHAMLPEVLPSRLISAAGGLADELQGPILVLPHAVAESVEESQAVFGVVVLLVHSPLEP